MTCSIECFLWILGSKKSNPVSIHYSLDYCRCTVENELILYICIYCRCQDSFLTCATRFLFQMSRLSNYYRSVLKFTAEVKPLYSENSRTTQGFFCAVVVNFSVDTNFKILYYRLKKMSLGSFDLTNKMNKMKNMLYQVKYSILHL